MRKDKNRSGNRIDFLNSLIDCFMAPKTELL